MPHCMVLLFVVRFEFEFLKFEFKLNTFESFFKKMENLFFSLSLFQPSRPIFLPPSLFFFLPAAQNPTAGPFCFSGPFHLSLPSFRSARISVAGPFLSPG
jgi:hypothetical protein